MSLNHIKPKIPLGLESTTPDRRSLIRRTCQFSGCTKGEDGGAYKTMKNLASIELVLDDMEAHYWNWQLHDVGQVSEWAQSNIIGQTKAKRAGEKRRKAVRMDDKKAREMLAAEGKGMESNWIWTLSEANQDALRTAAAKKLAIVTTKMLKKP